MPAVLLPADAGIPHKSRDCPKQIDALMSRVKLLVPETVRSNGKEACRWARDLLRCGTEFQGTTLDIRKRQSSEKDVIRSEGDQVS